MYFINNFAHIFQMNKFSFEYVNRYNYFYELEFYIKIKENKLPNFGITFYILRN